MESRWARCSMREVLVQRSCRLASVKEITEIERIKPWRDLTKG